LFRLDAQGNPRPHLVKDWEVSPDGLTWTFYLKNGITFHNGSPLRAEDVRFTFEMARDRRYLGNYSYPFSFVAEITCVSEMAVKVVLREPFAPFLSYLDVGILPKHLFTRGDLESEGFKRRPVGTGPFQCDRVGGEEVVLTVNSNYFDGRPYLERIVLRVFPDEKVMWAKFMSGEVDLFVEVSHESYEIMKNIQMAKLYSLLKPYYYMVVLNNRSDLFRDREVREALNYGIDKEELVQKVLKGRGQVAAGAVFPGLWAHNPEVKPFPYDPQKALYLLKLRGWQDTNQDGILDRNGKEFAFSLVVLEGDGQMARCAAYLQQQLLDLGIRVDVTRMSLPSLNRLLAEKGDFHAVLANFRSGSDPDINALNWHSGQIEGGYNLSGYRNVEVDRLFEGGRSVVDPEERRQYYFRFQEEMKKDPPGVFLFWRETVMAVSSRFRDVTIDPFNPSSTLTEWYVPKKEQKY
jgi:peptide/nickel transport system substrate-binding protein